MLQLAADNKNENEYHYRLAEGDQQIELHIIQEDGTETRLQDVPISALSEMRLQVQQPDSQVQPDVQIQVQPDIQVQVIQQEDVQQQDGEVFTVTNIKEVPSRSSLSPPMGANAWKQQSEFRREKYLEATGQAVSHLASLIVCLIIVV